MPEFRLRVDLTIEADTKEQAMGKILAYLGMVNAIPDCMDMNAPCPVIGEYAMGHVDDNVWKL